MSSTLFFEARNARLAVALRATLDDTYAGRVDERTGIVLSSSEVMVSNQRYEFSGGGINYNTGGSVLVQNIGRSAAAVYAPVRAGGTQAVNSGAVVPNGASAPRSSGPGGSDWNTINAATYAPSNTTYWQPSVPDTVSEALDIIAPKVQNYVSPGVFMTPDIVPADFTIPAGYTAIYCNMSVPVGITVTVVGTLVNFVLP